MTSLGSLLESIDRSFASASSLPMSLVASIGEKDRIQLRDGGLICVLPLWRLMNNVVALIGRPNCSIADWRAVVARDGHMMTLATSARLAVPCYLLTHFFADNARLLEGVADNWLAVRAVFEQVHAALGGDDRSLSLLDDAIADASIRRALGSKNDNPLAFAKTMSMLSRAVDPSSEFAAFADWMDAASAGESEFEPSIDAMGAWARLCVIWSFNEGQSKGKWTVPDANIGLNAVVAMSALDSSPPFKLMWDVLAPSGNGHSNLNFLTGELARLDLPKDEIEETLLNAIKVERLNYRGLAHAEAAALLDEADQPERAWDVLNSAAWWMGRGTVSPPAIYDGAKMICERPGWEQMQAALQYLFEGRR